MLLKPAPIYHSCFVVLQLPDGILNFPYRGSWLFTLVCCVDEVISPAVLLLCLRDCAIQVFIKYCFHLSITSCLSLKITPFLSRYISEVRYYKIKKYPSEIFSNFKMIVGLDFEM